MNNPEMAQAFDEIPTVEMTGPDGRVCRFRFGAVLPHEEQEYAVLLEMELDENGEEQVLITRIVKTEDGGLGFVVESDPEVIRAVFDAYVALGEELGLNGEE